MHRLPTRQVLTTTLVVLISSLLGFYAPLRAQQVPETPQAPPQTIRGIKVITPAKTPITNRIIFVVDCSGSMTNMGLIPKAIAWVRMISEQPTDHMEVAAIAFDEGFSRWPGVPEPPKIPPGWAALPSAEATNSLNGWLNAAQFILGGGTNLLPALQAALEDKRPGTSIVIVTDGGLADPPDRLIGMIPAKQKERGDDGRGSAILTIFGVHQPTAKIDYLVKIGEAAKDAFGGYYTEEIQ